MVILYANGKKHWKYNGVPLSSTEYHQVIKEVLGSVIGSQVVCLQIRILPSKHKDWFHALAPAMTRDILRTCLMFPSQVPLLCQTLQTGAPRGACPVCRPGYRNPSYPKRPYTPSPRMQHRQRALLRQQSQLPPLYR